jgi:hypothetical protein
MDSTDIVFCHLSSYLEESLSRPALRYSIIVSQYSSSENKTPTMDITLASNDSALCSRQSGNGSKAISMERAEDDAGSSPPHSATRNPRLPTRTPRRRVGRLAYKPVGRPLPFPFKLHYMLDDVEERGIQHIVSWMPSGIAFKVHKPAEFIANVVPCYFNLTKYKSFKRQLLNYGFERIEEMGEIREGLVGKFLYEIRRLSSIEVVPIQHSLCVIL